MFGAPAALAAATVVAVLLAARSVCSTFTGSRKYQNNAVRVTDEHGRGVDMIDEAAPLYYNDTKLTVTVCCLTNAMLHHTNTPEEFSNTK
jgi:hypothetical protein